ncbi:MAG: hypothetical protein ABWY11_04800 [Umezawaea sp.]
MAEAAGRNATTTSEAIFMLFPAFKKVGLAVMLAAAATGTAASPASASVSSPAIAADPIQTMSGSSTQSRSGLTCNNQWYNTLGKTNCTGTGSQRWRLKLTCQLQGDIYGTWQNGRGSDQNECNIRISSASIQWG